MEEIRAFACNEFLHHARAGQDAGGVLFGTRRDDLIRILTWRPIACENSRGSTLHLSLNDRMNLALQLEMARKNPDLKDLRPLGWFVSHPYGVALSDADRELYNGFFPESWQVTLVLQPQGAGRAQAAFFVRDASGKTSQEAQECFELGAPAVKVKVRTDPAPPEPAPAIPTTPPITASPISVPPVISAPITAPPVIAQPTVKIETAPPQVIATPPAPELPSPSPPEPPVGQPAVSAKVEIPPEPVPPVTAPPPEAKAAAKIDTAPEPKPQQAPKLGAAARKEPVKPAPPAAEVPGPTVSTPGTVPTSTAAPTPSVAPTPSFVPTPSFEIDDGPPARERWLWAIPIVLALSIAAVVLYQRKPAAGHSIGLRASNEAQTVQFVWDANSPAVRDAHRGELEVSDAGKSATIPLTSDQLHAGKMSYLPQSTEVSVVMTVYPATGDPIHDSTTLVAPMFPLATEPPQLLAGGKADSKDDSSAARTALENQVRQLRDELAKERAHSTEQQNLIRILEDRLGIQPGEGAKAQR